MRGVLQASCAPMRCPGQRQVLVPGRRRTRLPPRRKGTDLAEWLDWLGQADWRELKLVVEEMAGVSKDALHVLVGFFAHLAVAAMLRRGIASPWPWAALLVGASLNEWYDLATEGYWHKPMWPGSVKDLLLTMLIPTILLAAARWTPRLLGRGK